MNQMIELKCANVPKFRPGQVVATPQILETLTQDDILRALNRHVCGDWGEVCDEDKESNERALLLEERLLSAYTSSSGTKFWIITEADRSSTTILFPEEY